MWLGRKHVAQQSAVEGEGAPIWGRWTDSKLRVVADYLEAYTTALKKAPFKTAYIDAFAGTGYRAPHPADDAQQVLLPLAAHEPQELLAGWALMALKTQPRFDRYILIERDRRRVAELERLREEFSDLKSDIVVLRGEANYVIRMLCAKDWERHRAVLFLDPYGLQVEWTTIEAVAQTKAIDLWLLFPLGQAVNRLLTRSGDIPSPWRHRLDVILGTDDWYREFYTVQRTTTLFEDEVAWVEKASVDRIGRYFNRRLSTVFAGVAPEPKVLFNSANCPLYLLCFAVGSPTGRDIALRIADHLLKGVQ